MDDTAKLTIREKIGYGLGDCGANFVFQTQLVFLMSFYTDVLGIEAAAVGTMLLVSRLFDAVNDPLMGALADRTQTRWGKYRPWVLATAIPFAVLFVLAYTRPGLGPTGTLVWAYVTYNLLMVAYTANNIPYSALTGVLTSDPDERTTLVSWRFLMAMSASFAVQTFTPDLVQWFGGPEHNQAVGYQWTIGLWALLAVTCFVATFATTTERVAPPPRQESSLGRDLGDLFTSGPWLSLASATVFLFLCLAMRGGATPYYFDYVVAEKAPVGWGPLRLLPQGWFNGAGQLASVLGILLSRPLATRFGKRNVFIGALLGTAAMLLGFAWLPVDRIGWIVALQGASWFVYGISIPLLWAMMADVADYTEWRRGRRATAMTFAATVFALKVGLSLGGKLSGEVLQRAGYAQGAAEQPPEAIRAIVGMIGVLPAAALAASALCMLFFYRIGRPEEIEMARALHQKRSAETRS